MLSIKESKFIKSLKVKKYRVREKRFVVEGAKNVLELLRSDFTTHLVVCTDAFAKDHQVELKGRDIRIASEKLLSELGTFKSNNSSLAIAETRELPLSEVNYEQQIFVLDNVNDPGNLGTIIRTLDWFNFKQLVCSENTAELFNPKTISSTMGSFARVRVWYTELESFIKDAQLPVYGAEMEGLSLYQSKIKTPSIIVMGSESHGISSNVRQVLDDIIAIPRNGSAESLNVGVATGIIAGYLRMK